MYDLQGLLTSPAGDPLNRNPLMNDGFIEDIFLERTHERIFNKAMQASLDIDRLPSSEDCAGISLGVTALYFRTLYTKKLVARVARELWKDLSDDQKAYVSCFGAVTAHAIMEIATTLARPLDCLLVEAGNSVKFVTSDNPSVPCTINENNLDLYYSERRYEQIGEIIRYRLSLPGHNDWSLTRTWDPKAGLLCPLSPDWCIYIRKAAKAFETSSHVKACSTMTIRINQLIRKSADQYLIGHPIIRADHP